MDEQALGGAGGFEPGRLARVGVLLRGYVDEGVVPGVAALVARHGRPAAAWYLGSADPAGGRPVEAGTLFPLASITKPLTAALIMAFVEEGRIGLDEPAAAVLPELGRPETAGLTLRQLLTHTAGFPGFPDENAALRQARRPLGAFVAAFLGTAPRFAAGSQFCYSNVGVGLLGEVAARLSGRSYAAALRERVLDPWGLADVLLPLPEAEWPRAALVRDADFAGTPHETFNSPYFRGLGISWGGAYATAGAVAAFAQPFLDAALGTGGPCPLAPATRRAMVTVQAEAPPAPPDRRDELDARAWPAVPWGLGWEVRGPRRPHYTGELTSPTAFGHLGASGTCVWADPASGILAVLLTNQALSTGWSRAPARHARFANAVLAAAR